MTTNNPSIRFDAYVVENYQDNGGAEKATWMRIGVAFPHKDGKGFNIKLRATPVDGELVLRLHESRQEDF